MAQRSLHQAAELNRCCLDLVLSAACNCVCQLDGRQRKSHPSLSKAGGISC